MDGQEDRFILPPTHPTRNYQLCHKFFCYWLDQRLCACAPWALHPPSCVQQGSHPVGCCMPPTSHAGHVPSLANFLLAL